MLPCGDDVRLCRMSHRQAVASSASTRELAFTESMLESMFGMGPKSRGPDPQAFQFSRCEMVPWNQLLVYSCTPNF